MFDIRDAYEEMIIKLIILEEELEYEHDGQPDEMQE